MKLTKLSFPRTMVFNFLTNTLWLFNIAMENCPFIDALPIRNGGSFHGYVSHNQRVFGSTTGFSGSDGR